MGLVLPDRWYLCGVDGWRNRAVGIVAVIVAGVSAGVGRPIVRNRRTEEARSGILGHHFQIEIHHALAGHVREIRSHSVSGVAYRAGKSRVDVQSVLAEAGVGKNAGQVVALGAQRIRPAGRRIGDRR